MWDDEPAPKPRRVNTVLLDPLGVAELHDYIAELRAEIGRVEAMISRKTDQKGAADRLFQR